MIRVSAYEQITVMYDEEERGAPLLDVFGRLGGRDEAEQSGLEERVYIS